MKINVKHLVRPTYFAWFFFAAFIYMSIIANMIRNDGKEQRREITDRLTYIKDQRELVNTLSEADRHLKVTTMYVSVAVNYGQKFHKKYNKPKKWKYQGMDKKQLSDLSRLCYRWSRLTDVPYFDIWTTGLIETAYNPLARTYYEDGKTLCEAGWFQHRKEAVMQSEYFLHRMPDYLKKELTFTFNNMEDLLDPVTALKVQVCLFWGARRLFGNDPSWYVPAVHWGIGKMYRYYKNGMTPPIHFVFNRGTLREDVRNPFTYYFVWHAYSSQFERFTLDVFIEKGWLEQYRKECSKMEWNFIHSQRYVRDMVNLAEEYREQAEKYKKLELKLSKKMEEKIRNANNAYRKLHGRVKSGKLSSMKDVYWEGRKILKDLVLELESEKTERTHKVYLISIITSIIIIIIFSIIGMTVVVVTIFKKIKGKRNARRSQTNVRQ